VRDLVDALVKVPDLDEILVVDNASSDGTGEWLRTAEAEIEPLHARHLADNTGGAGGFHEGLRWAVEGGADLVWLMDDDGLPEPGCLETLLAHDGDLDFWGPVVVDETDPERLVFPIRLPGGTRVLHAMDDTDPSNLAVLTDLRRDLAYALSRLSNDQRIAVVLRDSFGMSYKEISRVARMPVGTAKCYVHRARARLRTLLEEYTPA